MFGAPNPFGQSSSPMGSQSVFGQSSGGATNPFAPKPFGSPSPFGSQTGSSMFGGTWTTGVFGQSPSPIASTPAFGASAPAFGASSAPAFGSSTPAFGGSAFGQKPAFGGFGSTPNQSSPFGGTFQQTQSAFGSNPFGSTPSFGASSQPSFGATSTPTFGSTSTPAFGSTSTPAFGTANTLPFGATPTPAFGATAPAFGSTAAPAFGSTPTPLFGSTGTAFGVSSTPAFGSTAAPAFGAPSTPSFGSASAPAFGATTNPFSTTTPSFGQSASTFGSAPFGPTPSPFGSQIGVQTPAPAFGSPGFGQSPFGGQPGGSRVAPYAPTPEADGGSATQPAGKLESISAMHVYKDKSHEELRWEDYQRGDKGVQTPAPAFGSPGFGQSPFGGQPGGSRVAPYAPTPEADGGSATQPAGKLESISAMHVYKDKSREELRWEDYQRGDKGGPNPSGQPTSGIGFPTPTQSNTFGSSGMFSQPAPNPFSSSTASSNIFAPKPQTFGSSGFGCASTSLFNSPFSSASSSPFGPSSTTSVFGAASSSGFGLNTSPSIFGGAIASSSTSSFGSSLTFGNTQSSGLFQSTTLSIGQAPSPFGQPSTGFPQITPGFGSNSFNTPSSGFGGLFSSSTPSVLTSSNPVGFGQTTPSLSTFQTAGMPQTSSAFGGFGGFGQPQSAPLGSVGNASNIFGQGSLGQFNAPTLYSMVTQPAPITNPFGTLPVMPQMSIGRAGSAPSVQYGISSMPVPFFTDDEETPTTPKADALFIPRENPRALIIRPFEQWPSRTMGEKQSMQKDNHPASTNGKVSGEPSAPPFNESCMDHYEEPIENGHNNVGAPSPSDSTQKPNGIHADHPQKGRDSSYNSVSGHRSGEAAIVYEHVADIEALMPKLCHMDYYTEPKIQELAAKERADPGFCRHVKDFVVGRHGYGSIKFLGETDVRRLDLDSIVQFNNREVIVYKDESKKPSIGQGLNKPAEVSLLNIKCMNRKTGEQYKDGPKVEKYTKMLMKKAGEQGAEFVSYDPVKGEWKFKVQHFSIYEVGDAGPEESDCYESGCGGAAFLHCEPDESLSVSHS